MRFATRGGRLALFLFSALAAPAAAQDYPASTDPSTLVAWLGESTNIAPATVVSVTPELVVAIVGQTPPMAPGGPVRLTLREEVVAAGYVQAVGGRSSLMSLEIQCEERRVRMDERQLYAGANLTGSAETTPPSAQWVRVPEGSIMDEVARAVCEPRYPWPLRAAEAKPQVTAGISPAEVEEPPPPDPPVEVIAVAVPVEPPAPTSQVDIDPPAEASEAPGPATAEGAPAPEPAQEEVSPPPPGPSYAAQIGAFETREAAEAAWAALAANRPVLVEGLRFDIQPVRVKGRDWLRGLVRDFATRDAAGAFCTALAGTGYGCILRKLAD